MKKKIILMFMFVIASLIVFTGCSGTVEVDEESSLNNIIEFNDKNLERAIREEINKPTGNVYLKDVKEIRELVLDKKT